MPKKKVLKNNPESFKDSGNKSFQAGNFQEAIDLFTQAIELAKDTPNYVYFANRANCYLELQEYEKCILDCNISIDINREYPKSFFRKGVALTFLQQLPEAYLNFQQGFKLDP